MQQKSPPGKTTASLSNVLFVLTGNVHAVERPCAERRSDGLVLLKTTSITKSDKRVKSSIWCISTSQRGPRFGVLAGQCVPDSWTHWTLCRVQLGKYLLEDGRPPPPPPGDAAGFLSKG